MNERRQPQVTPYTTSVERLMVLERQPPKRTEHVTTPLLHARTIFSAQEMLDDVVGYGGDVVAVVVVG